MARRSRQALIALALAGLALAACSSSKEAPPAESPASVETVPGTGQATVHLSAAAAKRIDLQTAKVETKPAPPRAAAVASTPGPGVATATKPAAPGDTEAPPAKRATTPPPTTAPPPTVAAVIPRLVVPFAAVLYQPNGDAFVYVDRGNLAFVRAPVVVDYVASDTAVLTSGPPADTLVVTVGAAQLLGAEAGVGDEELG